MLRGELSNRPAMIVAIDYRVLLDTKRPYEWFVKYVPELLMEKGFERAMTKALPWRPGARLWLESHWTVRFAVFTLEVPLLSRAVEMRVGSHVAEVYHFDCVKEFRYWLRANKCLFKVFTTDNALVGLDGLVELHSGWTEDL